jgi:hypothetical protein
MGETSVRKDAVLGVPAYRRGRVATVQRWFGWLDGQGAIKEHPIAAVMAALLAALTGHPADAEQWADAVDHWQYGDRPPHRRMQWKPRHVGRMDRRRPGHFPWAATLGLRTGLTRETTRVLPGATRRRNSLA